MATINAADVLRAIITPSLFMPAITVAKGPTFIVADVTDILAAAASLGAVNSPNRIKADSSNSLPKP